LSGNRVRGIHLVMSQDEYAEHRAKLVARLSLDRDVRDPRVLEAFRQVPRHEFVPESQRDNAYQDRALPLAEGQTISQPTMIAIMLEALLCQPTDRALEVGAGSGYAAALLGRLVDHVDAFEIRPAIAKKASETLARLGIHNVSLHVGNGCRTGAGPCSYQRILVSAGATRVPPSLTEKLACGGRIVIPVGSSGSSQVLRIGTKRSSGVDWKRGVGCVFVPLIQETTGLDP